MIYHYTSIESLALILESRKLRFTRLDRLDDLQEYNLFTSFPIYFSYYVSCWTEGATENIAQWKIYTPDMHGVRIGLDSKSIKLPTVKDLTTMNYDTFQVLATDHIRPYFQKVQYLDIESLKDILSEIVQKNGNSIEIGKNGYGVGIHKSKYWEFQNESRFILQITSIENGLNEGFLDTLKGVDQGYKYFDIPFMDNAFNDIEIVIGPKCTPAEKLIVEALLKSYGIMCEIKNSTLSEIIRKP